MVLKKFFLKKMSTNNYQYVVYGLGISGISTATHLANKNFSVIATDDNISALENFRQKTSKDFPNIKILQPDQISFDKNSIISFSPGIPLYFPKPHPILDILTKTQAQLKCDLAIFYDLNLQNNFIGITGTNGKSTTTALIGYIFNNLNIPSQIGGNIGIPCFELPQDQQNFYYIFETSSYQLDLISNTKFNIACLTNITPDHIDRHGTFENYIKSKKRIFQNQTHDDFAIICIDNPNCKKIYLDLIAKNHPAFMIATSTNSILENGLSIINDNVYINLANQQFEFKIQPFIKGQHNLENISIALSTAIAYLIKNQQFNLNNIEKIIKIIEKFSGLKHRLQNVRNIDNINFINDSKATNAESTENALKAYDNIFWILGGRAKDGGINSLVPYFSRIVKAYLIGESAEEFAKIFKNHQVDFEISKTLETAFKSSYEDCKKSDLKIKNILLSPACASFDQWKNFEERGDYFCKLANEI